MDINDLLNNQELKETFREVDYQYLLSKGNAGTLDEEFEKEIIRLTTDGKHPWDCKCLIHA